jgi:hypothetical protein
MRKPPQIVARYRHPLRGEGRQLPGDSGHRLADDVATIMSRQTDPSRRSGLQPNRRRVIYGVLILLDPSLTLTRMQCPATSGNRGNVESLTYAGFAILGKAQQPLTAHS